MSTKGLQILDSLIPPYDETLSETSTNAIQNKAVADAVFDLNTLIETKIAELNELLSALDSSIGSRISETIDPSLSISGMAADAKITGDAISNLKSKIFIGTTDEYNTAYANGSIQVGSLVILTDESVVSGGDETSAVLGVAILGQMVLQ